MGYQTWVNLALDPKVVTPSPDYPTAAEYWTWGAESSSGTFGDMATLVTGGGPYGFNYARSGTGNTPVHAGSILYGGSYGEEIPVTPGTRVTIQMWGWASVPSTARIMVRMWDSNRNPLGDVAVGVPSPLPASMWEPRSATIDTGLAAYLTPMVSFDFGSDSVVEFRGSALTVVPATAGSDYSGPYFDGDTADVPDVAEYRWSGTPNNSTSILTLTVEVPETQPEQVAAQIVPVPDPIIPRVFKPLYLKDFSVQEDSTPIYASDMTGGAGSMNLQVDENGDAPYLLDADIDLIDPAQGTTRGTIRNLSSDNTHASLVADSRMALLNVNRNASAVIGNLGQAVTYYFGLCGISDGYVIEESIRTIPVTFLGFSGNVWEELKRIGQVMNIEFNLVSNNIVVRPIRKNVSENYRDSSRSWAYDTTQKAQQVDIYKYDVQIIDNGLIYNGYQVEQTPMSVEAGQTAEFIIPFDGSIQTINQPVYLEDIGPGDPGFSAYNAIGNDNLPIKKGQWEDQGGRLTVAVSEDTRSIVVTIKAPYEPQYSPYTIGISDGNTRYSTLKLHGSAITYTKTLHSFHTAVAPDRVSQEIGATIDLPYIQTEQQLLDVAMGELRYWGGNRRTINVATRGINRLTDSGSYAYATFSDFTKWWDAEHPDATFGDFNTEAPAIFGTTFGTHNEWWIEEVQSDFANQAFGNIAGARVRTETNIHRIRTATTTPAGITYTAWEDSIFSDHDQVWGRGAGYFDLTNVARSAYPVPGPEGVTYARIVPSYGTEEGTIQDAIKIGGKTAFAATVTIQNNTPNSITFNGRARFTQSLGEVTSENVTIRPGESKPVTVRGITPNSTGDFGVVFTFPLQSSDPVPVDDITVTNPAVYIGEGATRISVSPIPFFDGNTPDNEYYNFAWVDRPNIEPSTRTLIIPTFADFDEHWDGRTFADFNATPLEVVAW